MAIDTLSKTTSAGTTASAINALNSSTSSSGTASSTSAANSLGASSASEQSDRFLKLLVSQMKNQDPLNPLDNAQVTSQMAQISTVTGLEKLNSTVGGLNGQFLQLQAMQGAALVGHDVALEGNALRVKNGAGDGGFTLGSKADTVKVEVLNGAGSTLDTLTFSGVDAGQHDFSWTVPSSMANDNLSFKVTATAGGKPVDVTELTHKSIRAVSTKDNSLSLDVGDGQSVPYSDVVSFL
jgi:flagellar basal-body rod modification protein FlgD